MDFGSMPLSCIFKNIFLLLNKVNPGYLKSVATSHTWPFSAVSELIGMNNFIMFS